MSRTHIYINPDLPADALLRASKLAQAMQRQAPESVTISKSGYTPQMHVKRLIKEQIELGRI